MTRPFAKLRRAAPLPLLLALALAPATPRAAPEERGAAAKVRVVSADPPGGTSWAPATVAARSRATLSTRLAAQVRAVHADEGQAVTAGQLLVSLSDADVRSGLAAAESALAAAAANERRIVELAKVRAATPAEGEQAAAQRAQAEAAVAAARASLGYTEIRAPFAGTVQARRVEPGDLVGPGQPMIELEGGGLELQASLSPAETRGLAPGASLAFAAGAGRGTAVVTALATGGDPVSHRRALRARVTSFDGELRSGTFARLELAAAAAGPGTVWVPRSALVERGDLRGVFVAASGRAELRWLSLGEDAGDAVAVRAGLRKGEHVIDAPGALRDGQAVEVLP